MSGRHEARPVRRLRVLALVRRGARSTLLVSFLFALLTATATAYLVVTPRLQGTAYDQALGDELRDATQLQRDLTLSLLPRDLGSGVTAPPFDGTEGPSGPGEGTLPPFDVVTDAARRAMGPDASLVGEALVAAQTSPFAIQREDGSELPGQPQAVVRVQDRLAEHVRWTSGAAPGAPTQTRVLLNEGVAIRRVHLLPVGVSDVVAKGLGLRTGSVHSLFPAVDSFRRARDQVYVVITGTFAPRDPLDSLWESDARMLDVASIPTPQGGAVRQGALLVLAENYPALSDSLRGGLTPELAPMGNPLLTHTWRYTVRDDLTRADAAPLARMASRLDTSSAMTSLPERPRLTTGVLTLLEKYERSLASTGVVTSFATAGVTALAAIVLMLTGLVATGRRLRELTLLASRGASSTHLLTMAMAGPTLSGLLAAAAAGALAVLLVDGVTPLATWAQVAVLVAAPALAIAALVLGTVRVGAAAAGDTVSRGRAWRRIVAEAGLVIIAVLAISTVRARGDVISGGQTDWYAALSPVLLAAAAAVVVFRALPAPIRALSRLAGRGRGYVSFLGLARSSRATGTAGLPLLALVVGASILTVVATIAATIGDERSLAAYRTVGADVRVDGARIEDADLAALRERPGVSAVSGAYVDHTAQFARLSDASGADGGSVRPVTLIGTDPAAHAAVVGGTPLDSGEPPPEDGSTATPGGRLPAIVSGGADVGDELELVVLGVRVPVTVTAIDPALARIHSGRLMQTALVPLDSLEAKLPRARPNTAYVKASAKASAALLAQGTDDRAAIGGLVTGVVSAQSLVESAAGRALPSFVTSSYAVAAALAGLLTFLTTVLLLVAGRPERRTLILRLRAMGVPRRAEAGLLAVEVLPLLVAAVLVGAAVGIAVPPLVSGAIDLEGYTGGPRPELSPSWVVGGLAALGAFLLAVLALAIEQVRTRRASAAEHQRAGGNP
ncbi:MULTISPECIES: FtsX-like permease family protein [unclassified Knoellia]|uniref:FtsX-like permease family protein n=1 Tax=Knoellia altitudinis TaxID=3404795 RepID=UPI00360B9BCF